MKALPLRTSLERLSLRTQLFLSTLLIICALTGSLLLIVRHTMRTEIVGQVRQSTDASVRAFQSVQNEHEMQLSRSAAMLAALPTLKALMTTNDAVTISDASTPFWQLAGSDLFVLANPQGKVLGLHAVRPGWIVEAADKALADSLRRNETIGWWYANGDLYWVFLRPIESGGSDQARVLGILVVGYQVDRSLAQSLSTLAGSPIVIAADGQVIASTLPDADEAALQTRILSHGMEADTGDGELSLATGNYQVAEVPIHEGAPVRVTCFVTMPLARAEGFISRLNQIIFIAGLSAVFLSAIVLSFVSRMITKPLGNLVAGVLALGSGDYNYSITPRGSSEVAAVGEAFANMRKELLASQQRKLATERVAALGRAADSLSHDLRHYLAALVANAEFLYEADRLKLDRDEVYEEIKAASKQMVDLLDSLRELSREQYAITPVNAFIDQVTRKAADAVLAIPELRTRDVSVTAKGQMDGIFDAQKIERAIFNLVLNACQAAPHSDGQVCIEIASSEKEFEIRIADNGSGIPASVRGTLFDPFVSAGKSNGTGLGLAIVQKIVHDHNGTISVEKTSEQGTVFLLQLPRAVIYRDGQTRENIPA